MMLAPTIWRNWQATGETLPIAQLRARYRHCVAFSLFCMRRAFAPTIRLLRCQSHHRRAHFLKFLISTKWISCSPSLRTSLHSLTLRLPTTAWQLLSNCCMDQDYAQPNWRRCPEMRSYRISHSLSSKARARRNVWFPSLTVHAKPLALGRP